MSWKNFEEECTAYLNEKYGTKFEQQGDSNSTISDILYRVYGKTFYKEEKIQNTKCV